MKQTLDKLRLRYEEKRQTKRERERVTVDDRTLWVRSMDMADTLFQRACKLVSVHLKKR